MTEEQIDKILEEYQMIYIDDIPLNNPKPAPDWNFSKKEQDLDSGVNLEGYMERNILEHHRRTLDLSFPSMNGEQMKRILEIFDKPTVIVKVFDPWLNEIQTNGMQMMHGDLTPKIYGFFWDYANERIDVKYHPITIQLVEY